MARRASADTNGDRVLLYVRVSSLRGRGGDDFHSPEVQLDGMRNLITRERLHEVAVIDDDIDVSGQTFNRKGIARIRELVETRQIDVVAVNTLNRVGRNLAESLTFIRWLRERAVRIISANEKIDDSAEGQFMLGMWLNLAELQGNQIGDSWARIIERRARLGRTHGAAPHGYLRGDSGAIEPDPAIGPAVVAVFNAYARGDPIIRIVEAYRTATGRPVDRRVVKRLLYNPVYVGRVVVKSRTGGDINLPGQHEPLVDDITWQKVQRRLAADASTPARYLAPAHALTGLGICVHCEHLLGVKSNYELDAPSGQRIQVARLHCDYGRFTGGCKGVGTPRCALIEDAVLTEIAAYVRFLRDDRPPSARRGATPAEMDAPRLERELARTREAMTKLTKRWALGGLPDDMYESTLDEFRATEADLESRWETARLPTEAPPPAMMRGLAEELLELWPDMLADERNRSLRTVVTGVTLRRGAFWREPDADRIVAVNFRWPHGFGS
jgi:site-specific DNA recombinase